MSSKRTASLLRPGGAAMVRSGQNSPHGTTKEGFAKAVKPLGSGPRVAAINAAGSRKSTPGSSPASSGERQGAARQKPKPSGAKSATKKASEAGVLASAKGALASHSTGAAAAKAEKLDDEPFVPEEEEEGPTTQGDGLMMAKARRQKSLDGQQGAELPIPAPEGEAAGGEDDEPFVPEEEEEGPMTQGDGLMMAKARRQQSLDGSGSMR